MDYVYVVLMTNATGGVTLNEAFLKLFLDSGKARRYAQERANAIPKDLPDRIELVQCDAENGDIVARHTVEPKRSDTKKHRFATFVNTMLLKNTRHYEVLSAGSDTILGLVMAECPYEAHRQAVALNKGGFHNRFVRIRRVGHVQQSPYTYVVYWTPSDKCDTSPILITTDQQEAADMVALLKSNDTTLDAHFGTWERS